MSNDLSFLYQAEVSPSQLLDVVTQSIKDEVIQKTIERIQWFAPGFFSLLLDKQTDENGSVIGSVQANFYHPDFPGQAGPHAHARSAHSQWLAPVNSKQRIVRHLLLPPEAKEATTVPTKVMRIATNRLTDRGDARK